MKRTALTLTFVIMAIVVAFAVSRSITAQGGSEDSAGGGIVGTWLFRGGPVDCTTGLPLGPPPPGPPRPTLVSFNRGGTYIQEASNIRPSRVYPGLGVWRHVNARNYALAFRVFQYKDDGTPNGYVISNVEVEHNLDDTLSNSAVVGVFDNDGNPTSSFCLKTTGTRFTGEN